MTTFFELALDDTSPVVSYFPFAETLGAPDLLAGWNSFFSQSGFLSQLGETGIGDSMHVTSLDGAVFTIQWFGTGISLFGSAVDATYDVSLDGAAPSLGLPRGDLLAVFQDLDLKQHLVALTAHPIAAASNSSSFVSFDRAALNVSTNLTGATVSSEFVNASSSRWFFSGDWTELSDPVLSSQPSQSYRVSNTRANTATIAFRGSAVSVTGVRNTTNGHYNVTLDGTTTTFDGHSDWLETSTLFLQAGLDETVRHSLTISNTDDASLAISGLNITHVSGGTLTPGKAGGSAPASVPSPGLSTGTIIALVLAGIIAVLGLLTLVACIYFRRRKRTRRPTFTAGDTRSGVFFRELGERWAPKPRRKSRPTHLSKSSDYGMQDLHSAQPLGRRTAADTPVGLRNNNVEILDPMSPTPYLRMPRLSPFQVDVFDGDNSRREWERPRLDSVRESNRSSVPSVVRELLEAHSRPDSGVIDPALYPQSLVPGPQPRPTHARRRSRSMEVGPSSRGLRLDIPNSPPNANTTLPTPTPRSATTQRAWRSPLLLQSPLRGPRRNTRRTSFGTAHLLSPMQETPLSVSTIQFGRPWEGRRESMGESERTSEDAPPARARPPQENRAASEILERLRARRAERAAQAGPSTSTWKPPW